MSKTKTKTTPAKPGPKPLYGTTMLGHRVRMTDAQWATFQRVGATAFRAWLDAQPAR